MCCKRRSKVTLLTCLVNDPDLSVTSLTKKSEEDISNVSDGAISKLSTVAPPPSQNWFMKIFNIKPASRVFALSVSKPRAKKEILKILREWKKYGMEKIRFDRQSNVLRARVGERNCKHSPHM